jgi:hypothetical protein
MPYVIDTDMLPRRHKLDHYIYQAELACDVRSICLELQFYSICLQNNILFSWF